MAGRNQIARAAIEANPFWVAPKCPCGMDHGCDPFQGAREAGASSLEMKLDKI